ncbi:MAG: S8 family serine peptidase [Lachnospiraceae bacterium]|nr:S8 family serine peptidase [Lachnospiraceae bacterium]
MKKSIKHRLLAILIAVSVVFSLNGTVFASEEVLPDKTVISADQPAVEDETDRLSENGTEDLDAADEGPTEAPEGTQPSENTAEIPVAEDAEPAEGTQPSENAAEIPIEEEAGSEVSENLAEGEVPEETISENLAESVFNGMPEAFTLSEKQIEGKKNIIEHDVLNVLETLEAGKDYAEDEVIFSCDDPEYAKVVAKAYNGTLRSCDWGVAVIKLDTASVTVEDAVKAGADITNSLPPVEPNTFTKLDDPVKEDNIRDPDMESLNSVMAKRGSIGGRGWSYWRERFNDKALDPAYMANDPLDENINKNMYQWMHDTIGSYQAWGATQGEGVTVAVIDTGVYSGHPDLKGQVTEIVTSEVVAGTKLVDNSGHGTHVAGIIASAANNSEGGVGVAPKAKILGLPIFESNGCSAANEAAAVNYVANGKKADVINMSIGGPLYSQIVQDAVNKAHEAGITICVAMGNESANNVAYPVAYDNVIAVASLDESLQKSDFSTHGEWADIAAPGTDIYSTWNGHFDDSASSGAYNLSTDYDYWGLMSGTSMATPVVAGVCALYISAKKAKGETASPDEVEKALKQSATKISSPYKIGAGMINAAKMLSLIESTQAPVINVPGTISSDSVITVSDNNAAGKTQGFIYTVNGKKPSIKGGEIKEGIYIENPADPGTVTISVEELVKNGIQADESVKLQVLRITGIGTASDIATRTVQIPNSAAVYEVVGPVIAAKGKSVTYKLNPGFKKGKVTWSLDGSPTGVTINKKTGKVSIKKSASGGFTVIGEAEGKKGTLAVKIVDPARSVTLKSVSVNKDLNDPKTDKNGNLKSVRIYNVDISATKDITENEVVLEGKADNGAGLLFTSSKPSIVQVDASGKITGKKAGKAKITCKATDGSNKKLVLTVKVLVPVSRLDMFPDKSQRCVAYGKKMKIRPALGSAYGTPTEKKVEWEIVRVEGITSGTSGSDVTSNAKNYIKLSKGKLSINKKLATVGSYKYYNVTVRLKATDGTGLTKDKTFLVVAPTTKLKANYKSPQKVPINFINEVDLFSGNTGWDYSMGTGRVVEPEVISSNPAVANAYVSRYSAKSDEMVYLCIISARKKGSCTITIKATDCTGKKASFKLKVK